jgi:general stress protein 26
MLTFGMKKWESTVIYRPKGARTMGKTANEIQKERIKEIEEKASQLLEKCTVVTLASVNEKGYPRICAISKIRNYGFYEIYFMTSKRSHIVGKAPHFENNTKASVCYCLSGDSVTLIGDVDIVTDIDEKRKFDKDCDRNFFKKGIEDPKCYLLRFRTNEATFWIEGKFRTCKYKAF